MTERDLDRIIGDLTAVLGDATRRGIYIFVREAAEPVTAAMAAEEFGIHANVARHHLDRLAEEGYLQVTRRRRSGRDGPGAGRPAKCYRATGKEINLQFPARRYELLAGLLVGVIEEIAPEQGRAVAERVGRRYGLALAADLGLTGRTGFAEAVSAAADALGRIGFDVRGDPAGRRLVYRNCPFGSVAEDHQDVVCALDQGIVQGLMESLHQRSAPVTAPHSLPDGECVTAV